MGKNSNLILLGVFFSLIFCLSVYIFLNQALGLHASDLQAHIVFTKLHFSNEIVVPHNLFHTGVYVLSSIFGIGLQISAVLLLSFTMVVTTMFYFQLFKIFISGTNKTLFYIFITIVLITVSAIYIPQFNIYIYYGQGTPNVWHNPTTIFVKPFAFLSFLMSLKLLKESRKEKIIKYSILTSLTLMLSTLAKPNFITAFIPGLILFLILYHRQNKAHCIKFSLIVLPSICILMYQYLQTYHLTDSKLVIDVLGVWGISSPNPFVSLLLLTAFPLSILVFYKKSWENRYLIFSWIIFVVSLLQFIIFAEVGGAYSHGNLGWGMLIILPMIFLFSLVEYINRLKNAPYNIWDKFKLSGITIVLSLHFFSGLLYLTKMLLGCGFF